jgi:hypothetical protein
MSSNKLGKREREARKRHRRCLCWNSSMDFGAAPLKLGHEHLRRSMRDLSFRGRWLKGKLAKGAEECSSNTSRSSARPVDFPSNVGAET